ncbi:MAG: LamG-like jellyroll fold domain-containing protein [Candidatus Methylacidiphilales bacterium]|nr:LamG-like jellyroll fold domain-containing protein [Candidatus Methylacidiphilales bacterium]
MNKLINRSSYSIHNLPGARIAVCAGLLLCAFGSVQAATLSYWRFEDQADGGQLEGNLGGGPFTTTADYSGNGNPLRTFDGPAGDPGINTSPTFGAGGPGAIVPQTGASSTRWAYFNGTRDIYTDSTPLNSFNFTGNFTIEASIYSDATGWKTFLGRDQGGTPGPGGQFFYQQRGDNGNLGIALLDGSGTLRVIDSGFNIASSFTWFNTALVSSGGTLTLYLQDNLDQSWDVVGTTTTAGGLNNSPATWTVGRGWFGGPNDFWSGGIDEVRISDTALTTDQFLWSSPIPEPSTYALFGVGALALYLTRRKLVQR